MPSKDDIMQALEAVHDPHVPNETYVEWVCFVKSILLKMVS